MRRISRSKAKELTTDGKKAQKSNSCSDARHREAVVDCIAECKNFIWIGILLRENLKFFSTAMSPFSFSLRS